MTYHANCLGKMPGMKRWAVALLLGLYHVAGFGDTITLSWEAPALKPVARYKVYRADGPANQFLPVASTVDTYAKISSPGSSEGQLFYVTAVDEDGAESSPSNVIEIGKTLGVRVEPDLLTFEWNDGRFILESSSSLDGPWEVYETTSPAFADTSRRMRFFRLRNL